MSQLDDQGRPEPPLTAGETDTLTGFLDYQRATLAWKCSDVDAAGLRAEVGVSTMTLGGLLKHLAYVEDLWFSRWLRGNAQAEVWAAVDWKARPDWEWETAAQDSAQELFELWQTSVQQSRTCLEQALAEGGLEQLAQRSWPSGESPSLRWILVHMIEEYARHNGHADLLRESVDGETGE